jgi:excisionase family DNA binding protein
MVAAVPDRDWRHPVLLRPSEAANALGVSRSRCYELMAAGELPHVRIGGSLRIPVAELDQWIAERLADATQSTKGEGSDRGRPETRTR